MPKVLEDNEIRAILRIQGTMFERVMQNLNFRMEYLKRICRQYLHSYNVKDGDQF